MHAKKLIMNMKACSRGGTPMDLVLQTATMHGQNLDQNFIVALH